MKKTLIVLAALAATASFAQSSVTLYGKANIGIAKLSTGSAALTGGADGSDSRWGMRGTEDLGGGLKANFVFESGFKPDTGNNDNTANQGFQRSAWAGLSGGFGEVRAGRQYTLGFHGSIGNMPATSVGSQLAAGLGFNGAGSRNSDQIQYWSPKFSGFQVRVSHVLKGDTATNATEMALNYSNGPLTANLTSYETEGTAGRHTAINAAYNLGMATIAAGNVDKAGTLTGKGNWVLATLNNAGAFAPFVGYAKNSDSGVSAVEVGTFYALSKRTRLYALYGSNRTTDVSTTAVGFDHNF